MSKSLTLTVDYRPEAVSFEIDGLKKVTPTELIQMTYMFAESAAQHLGIPIEQILKRYALARQAEIVARRRQ